MRRNLIICLLLAGITLTVYWPVRNYDLVSYDDPLFLTENPEVQSGLNIHSFAWAMSSVVIANWHPVTSLSFVVTHQLFGTNPGAEHLVNVMFHAANAALLFLVLLQMTSLRADASARQTRSLAMKGTGSQDRSASTDEHHLEVRGGSGAVFCPWHPLRVESVAWIAE